MATPSIDKYLGDLANKPAPVAPIVPAAPQQYGKDYESALQRRKRDIVNIPIQGPKKDSDGGYGESDEGGVEMAQRMGGQFAVGASKAANNVFDLAGSAADVGVSALRKVGIISDQSAESAHGAIDTYNPMRHYNRKAEDAYQKMAGNSEDWTDYLARGAGSAVPMIVTAGAGSAAASAAGAGKLAGMIGMGAGSAATADSGTRTQAGITGAILGGSTAFLGGISNPIVRRGAGAAAGALTSKMMGGSNDQAVADAIMGAAMTGKNRTPQEMAAQKTSALRRRLGKDGVNEPAQNVLNDTHEAMRKAGSKEEAESIYNALLTNEQSRQEGLAHTLASKNSALELMELGEDGNWTPKQRSGELGDTDGPMPEQRPHMWRDPLSGEYHVQEDQMMPSRPATAEEIAVHEEASTLGAYRDQVSEAGTEASGALRRAGEMYSRRGAEGLAGESAARFTVDPNLERYGEVRNAETDAEQRAAVGAVSGVEQGARVGSDRIGTVYPNQANVPPSRQLPTPGGPDYYPRLENGEQKSPFTRNGDKVKPDDPIEGQWIETPEGLRPVDRPQSTSMTTAEYEAWKATQEMRARALRKRLPAPAEGAESAPVGTVELRRKPWPEKTSERMPLRAASSPVVTPEQAQATSGRPMPQKAVEPTVGSNPPAPLKQDDGSAIRGEIPESAPAAAPTPSDEAKADFNKKWNEAYGGRPETAQADTALSEKNKEPAPKNPILSSDEAKRFAKMSDSELEEYNRSISPATDPTTTIKSAISELAATSKYSAESPNTVSLEELRAKTGMDAAELDATLKKMNASGEVVMSPVDQALSTDAEQAAGITLNTGEAMHKVELVNRDAGGGKMPEEGSAMSGTGKPRERAISFIKDLESMMPKSGDKWKGHEGYKVDGDTTVYLGNKPRDVVSDELYTDYEDLSPDVWYIENIINRAPEYRNNGSGTFAMESINHLADKNGITLRLWPKATDSGRGALSDVQLDRWYRKLGFSDIEGVKNSRYLERKPKMKLSIPWSEFTKQEGITGIKIDDPRYWDAYKKFEKLNTEGTPNGQAKTKEAQAVQDDGPRQAAEVQGEGQGKEAVDPYTAAKQRIGKKAKGQRLGSGPLDFETMADLYTIGKHHYDTMAGKIRDFASWSKNVLMDAGDWVRDHLMDLWQKVKTKPPLLPSGGQRGAVRLPVKDAVPKAKFETTGKVLEQSRTATERFTGKPFGKKTTGYSIKVVGDTYQALDPDGNIVGTGSTFKEATKGIEAFRNPAKVSESVMEANKRGKATQLSADETNARSFLEQRLGKLIDLTDEYGKGDVSGYMKKEGLNKTLGAIGRASEKIGEVRATKSLMPVEQTIGEKFRQIANESSGPDKTMNTMRKIREEVDAVMEDFANMPEGRGKQEAAREALKSMFSAKRAEALMQSADGDAFRVLEALRQNSDGELKRATVKSIEKLLRDVKPSELQNEPDGPYNFADQWREAMNNEDFAKLAEIDSQRKEIRSQMKELRDDAANAGEDPNPWAMESLKERLGVLDERIGDVSTQQLGELYDSLSKIKAEHAQYQQMEKQFNATSKRKLVDQAAVEINLTHELTKDFIENGTAGRKMGRGLARAKDWVIKQLGTPETLIDYMTGGDDKHIIKRMWNASREAHNKKIEAEFSIRDKVLAKQKELGIDELQVIDWRSKKNTFDAGGKKFDLTDAQLINLHLEMKDAGLRSQNINQGFKTVRGGDRIAMRDENGKIDTTANLNLIEKMLSKLTPNQRALADTMAKAVNDYALTRGNETARKRLGHEIYFDDQHWTLAVDPRDLPAPKQDLLKQRELYSRKGFGSEGANQERISHKHPPVIEDVFDVFNEKVKFLTNFAEVALPYEDIMGVLSSKQVRNSIERRLGTEYFKKITDVINESANKGDPTPLRDNPIFRSLRWLNRRFSTSILGLRVTSGIKSYYGSSLMAANELAKIDREAGSVALNAMKQLNPRGLPKSKENTAAINALEASGYFRHRFTSDYTQIVGNLKAEEFKDKSRLKHLVRKAENKSMFMMLEAEKSVAIEGYKNLVSRGFSSDKAVKMMELAFRRTQNPSTVFEHSSFTRALRDSGTSAILPFTGQRIAQYNMIVKDMVKLHGARKRGESTKQYATDAAKTMTAFAVNATADALLAYAVYMGGKGMLGSDPENDTDKQAEIRERAQLNAVTNAAGNMMENLVPILGSPAAKVAKEMLAVSAAPEGEKLDALQRSLNVYKSTKFLETGALGVAETAGRAAIETVKTIKKIGNDEDYQASLEKAADYSVNVVSALTGLPLGGVQQVAKTGVGLTRGYGIGEEEE